MKPSIRNIAVAALACLLGTGCSKPPEGVANRKPAEPTDGGAFEVARVERRSVERTITTTGSLLPLDRTPVSVKVAGRISEIAADLGSVVRKGDLIAQVEDADYALRVRQAEAALWQARAQAFRSFEGAFW